MTIERLAERPVPLGQTSGAWTMPDAGPGPDRLTMVTLRRWGNRDAPTPGSGTRGGEA